MYDYGNIKISYKMAMKKIKSFAGTNVITKELIAKSVAKKPADVHKGSCGKLLVCAGSEGMTGAATLSVLSAMRCGCGLVTLACAKELNTIFEIKLTEAMTLPVLSEYGKISYSAKNAIADKLNQSTAFLLGPGLAQSPDLRRLVRELTEESTVPVVIDADGLNALVGNKEALKNAAMPVIITPHIGEFARLGGYEIEDVIKNGYRLAKSFATDHGCTVVLKSHRTLVALPNGELYVNALGNAGMAKGGSGDVLAGAIASFLAQGCTPELAALAGVFFHSLAADIAVQKTGEYSLVPGDIINCMMYAIKETQDEMKI